LWYEESAIITSQTARTGILTTKWGKLKQTLSCALQYSAASTLVSNSTGPQLKTKVRYCWMLDLKTLRENKHAILKLLSIDNLLHGIENQCTGIVEEVRNDCWANTSIKTLDVLSPRQKEISWWMLDVVFLIVWDLGCVLNMSTYLADNIININIAL
jgi:hypothetical protein